MSAAGNIAGRWGWRGLVAAHLLAIVACSGSEQRRDAALDTEVVSIPWGDRTLTEKGQFMRDVVNPEMVRAFRQFSAEEFRSVGCVTCHGENPEAVDFAMPSPTLSQLDPADGFAAHGKRSVEFMMHEVTPRLAELLDVEQWSPENPEGIGCFSCHTPSPGAVVTAERFQPPSDRRLAASTATRRRRARGQSAPRSRSSRRGKAGRTSVAR